MELLTFCLRCTKSAATVPQGGIRQQQYRSGIAAAQNLQTEKTIIYYGCYYSRYEIYTPTKHLHIHNLIHN